MNVTHFSTFESGGAGHAAYRIHRSLVDHEAHTGVQSRLRVIYGCSQDETVSAGPAADENPIWRRLRPRLASLKHRGFNDGNSVLHSTCWPDSGVGKELRRSECSADSFALDRTSWPFNRRGGRFLNLWCGRCMTSGPSLAQSTTYLFRPPLIAALLRATCAGTALHMSEVQTLIASLGSVRNVTGANRSRSFVLAAGWLAEARASSLMSSWPIHVIPYPIDGNLWSPLEQQQARQELGLPQYVPLILFTALSGTSDPRKGADLLQAALGNLAKLLRDKPIAFDHPPELVIIGDDGSRCTSSFPFPVHFRGVLTNNQNCAFTTPHQIYW